MDKKILFMAGHEFLYNPQNGGQKCSLRNYRLMQEIFGKENVFLCIFSNYRYENLEKNIKCFPTQSNYIELFINTLTNRNVCNKETMKQVKNYVKELEIDCVFVDSSTIGYLISKMKFDVPVIIFFHNIEKNYAWNKFKHEGKKYLIAYWSYKKNESLAVKNANKVVLLNSRDEKELFRIYGRKADCFLPITFEDEFDEAKVPQIKHTKTNILFVGSLFQPNYEGIKWFVDEVMSRLESSSFVLKIVGKNLETKSEVLAKANVCVIGTVDDLSQYYYEADCVIIPIFYGDGMKVKTAEAMMYGKKILATDEALEGYEVSGTEGIIRCNTSDDFINSLNEIRKNQNEINYSYSVRELFKKKYETQNVKNEFQKFICDEVLNDLI